ncbi:MAG TPA: ABC transporter substrate-binding protein [Bacilli bacterium]|nr:ABC transporter substrate-binding protein [Bacilli bacterium]
MMKGKKVVSALALTTQLFTLTACGGDSDKSQVETVRLTEVVRSIFYAPQYVALEQGYFQDEGLNVRLDTAWGGDKAMTRLLAGQDDVALIGAETTVYVKQQGSEDAVINFAQMTQRDGTFLVARKEIDNFDWSMLKGKSLIGSRNGSMPEMVNEWVLKNHGIEPKVDNEIIQNISFDNMTTAFASGTGDFYQAFEPGASLLEKSGQGHVVASYGKDGGKLPYTVYMAKSSYLQDHPQALQKFTNAIQKAQTFVQESTPEEVAKIIAPYFEDVDQDILVSVVKRYKDADTWPSDTIIDRDEFDHMKRVMHEAGELKNDVKYEDVVNTTFAEKAK